MAEQLRAAARRRAAGCCSTASSTPRSPTRAPGAGWAWSGRARSTRFATGGLTPDRTLLLRIDPAAGLARAGRRAADADRLEREELAFFAAIARAYDELAAAEPERIRVIDAARAPAAVLAALPVCAGAAAHGSIVVP